MAITLAALLTLRDQFSAQFNKAASSAKAADSAISGLQGKMSALSSVASGNLSALPQLLGDIGGKGLLAAAGIGAVVAAGVKVAGEIKRINDETIAYADGLRKVSQAAGISAGYLSSLTEVADDFAISSESVNTSILKLSANIGGGTFQKAMQGLVPPETLANIKTAQDAIPVLADVFKQLGPSAEASRLAVELFGRGGQELIPILTQGSAELKNLQKAATDSGIAMSGAALKQMEALRRVRDAANDTRVAQERS